MSPALIAFIDAVTALVPKLILLGQDIIPFVQILIKAWNAKTDPTEADWAELARMEAGLRQDLQRPIDPGI